MTQQCNNACMSRVLARGNLKEGGFLINSHCMYEHLFSFSARAGIRMLHVYMNLHLLVTMKKYFE